VTIIQDFIDKYILKKREGIYEETEHFNRDIKGEIVP
jgi:hypothetical protein